MSKKYKKHGYADGLKYMHVLEEGYSINYIHDHYGISHQLLSSLWGRYQYEGPPNFVIVAFHGNLVAISESPKCGALFI